MVECDEIIKWIQVQVIKKGTSPIIFLIVTSLFIFVSWVLLNYHKTFQDADSSISMRRVMNILTYMHNLSRFDLSQCACSTLLRVFVFSCVYCICAVWKHLTKWICMGAYRTVQMSQQRWRTFRGLVITVKWCAQQ